MEKFLPKVASYINSHHQDDLRDVLICFPNNRSAYFFREEMKVIQASGFTPEVITFSQFIYDASPLSIIPSLELTTELYNVYASLGGPSTFEEFISSAQTMLADFDEIDIQCVNTERFFKNLQDLKSINSFLEDEETLSEYSQNYRDFWGLFKNCYYAFKEKLVSEDKAYNGLVFRNVAENLSLLPKEKYSQIYFVGFTGLTKSEEIIVQYLIENNKAEFLVDADNYYLKNDNQEAGFFYRKYLKEWKVKDLKWQDDSILSSPKKIQSIGVAKNFGQVKLAADLLQNHLHVTKENAHETAIVLLDERLLAPLVAALPDTIDTLNVSMGLALSDTQLYDFICLLHDLFQNSAKYSSANQLRFYHKDVMALLQHPYSLLLAKKSHSLSNITNNILKENKIYVAEIEVAQWFEDDAFFKETIFTKLDSVENYFSIAATWIEKLRIKFLQKIHSGEKKYQQDIEVLFWFKNSLQALSSNFKTEWSLKILYQLLETEIKATRIPFESDVMGGLQLMGIMETRSLDYKNVIILSMNEGVFPSGKSQNTYIPTVLRKDTQMTTHTERDAISAYLFYRLIQRSENVYMLYNTESDRLGGGEKSRFILQIENELAKFPSIHFSEKTFVLNADLKREEHPIEVKKEKALIDTLVDLVTNRGLSPSALNCYINCSLQFYFKYVLKLRESNEIEEHLEANTIGSAVHYALEQAYTPFLNRVLHEADIDSLINNENQIANWLKFYLTTEEKFDNASLSGGKNYLLLKVCMTLVLIFLKNEKKRISELQAKGETLTITMLEAAMSSKITTGENSFLVNGFTDRVDVINGLVRVADYKTGSPSSSKIKLDDWEKIRTEPEYSKAFQLLTYAWLYDKNIAKGKQLISSGIYWLRDAQGNFDALQTDHPDNILDAATFQKFEEVLSEIFSEIINPSIQFKKAEDEKRCLYCDFTRICGRD